MDVGSKQFTGNQINPTAASTTSRGLPKNHPFLPPANCRRRAASLISAHGEKDFRRENFHTCHR